MKTKEQFMREITKTGADVDSVDGQSLIDELYLAQLAESREAFDKHVIQALTHARKIRYTQRVVDIYYLLVKKQP